MEYMLNKWVPLMSSRLTQIREFGTQDREGNARKEI